MMRKQSESQRLYDRACRVVPGGVNSALRNFVPHLVIREARGATLTDADGNEYIDYQAAFGPPLLGHNHPEVNRRVAEALSHPVLAGAGTTELEIRVAEKICQHLPSAEKVLLTSTGSEATYHALRVARAATGRKKIIKFQGCYHGFHDSVLCNIASPAEKLGRIDPGSAGILRETLEQTIVCRFNDLAGVEAAMNAQAGDVAAIILEPIQHNVGCVLPQPGFLEGLRKMCTERGTVLIFDEVITGFRHSLGGFQAIGGVTPDLTTLAKSIANGFPMAALCGKAELMDHFKTRTGGDTFFAGTFNGNAVGCAAALATMEILEREPVHEHIFRLGDRLRAGLREIHARHGTGATVAGFGSIFLSYFMAGPIESYDDLLRNDERRFLEYRRRVFERGIFKLPVNLKRNHVSYAHTDAQVDRTLEVCDAVLKDLGG
jgi:glutamate-1-semialdehyde 2,1-aminomutase